MADAARLAPRTPWSFWVVSVLAVLWNGMGALDFTMSATRNVAYLKSLSPEQLAYFTHLPIWVMVFWGMGTWGGLLGSLLLLFRRALAPKLFAISLIGMIGADLYTYALSDGLKVMKNTTATLIFATIIFVIGVFLWRYALAMRHRGVLR